MEDLPQDENCSTVTYNCPSCPQSYQNANAFTKHAREKHFMKVFTCRQCEQFFDSLSQLFLHARRTHVDPKKPGKNPSNYKFHCQDCNYMTNNGGTMEHHRRAHSGVKPYVCEICQKTFAQKANMKTHQNRHIHKERIFNCDTCSRSFNSHDIYLAHLRTREHELQQHFQLTVTSKVDIQCLGCNLNFRSYYEVNIHSRNCEILKELTNKFWCVPCNLQFRNSMSLKTHLKEHGGIEIIACPVCGEEGFPGFNQLNHHITRAHTLKVNRRHVCRYCEMTFETKVMLDDHIEDMHKSEKNARQSRGAAGRLRCRYQDCDFTSNSVMLMDRHHDQHVNDTLPSSTTKRPIKRIKKSPSLLCEKRELVDMEFEHMDSLVGEDEVFRLKGFESRLVDIKNEKSDFHLMNSTGDDELDDLKILAYSFMENSGSVDEPGAKRKRGRPRKVPQSFTKPSPPIKNEHFDITETFI